MRFALINVRAFKPGFRLVSVVTRIPVNNEQTQIIGQNLEADMLEIVGRSHGHIPFIFPPEGEEGRLFYVNDQEYSILYPLFEALVWTEIHGLDDEPY